MKDTYVMPEKSIFQLTDAEIVALKKKIGKKRLFIKVDPVQFVYGQQ